MALILFDDHSWDNLLPLTFTRPVSALRVGIMTIAEKWEHDLESISTPLTREYLQGRFPCEASDDKLYINSSLLPDSGIVGVIQKLKENQALVKEGVLLAVRNKEGDCDSFKAENWIKKGLTFEGKPSLLDYPWKIFQLNGQELEADFLRITKGRSSEKLSDTVRVDQSENVFVEPGFSGGYLP